PIVEEIGFRVLLIGVPLFAMYSHRISAKHFFKSLWHPFENLHVYKTKRVISLIILVAVFFGVAHIISGESWSSGKFAQATASGIIIGWVYFRYGFAPAVLIHWATNYFIFSYVFLVADINFITVTEAFSHSLINTLEILFVISGIVSVGILILSYFHSKREKNIDKVVSYEKEHNEELEGNVDSYLDNNPNPKTFADNLDEDLPSKS
ncbi:MAG: CPBP family intramembrane glutamic endopeptidase, partial [Nitrosopumilaceae archaeon]